MNDVPEKPIMRQIMGPNGLPAIIATHPILGNYNLYFEKPKELLFTENETNTARIYYQPNASPYVKYAFRDIVDKEIDAINPEHLGTKAAVHYQAAFQPREENFLSCGLINPTLKSPSKNLTQSCQNVWLKPMSSTPTCNVQAYLG